MRFRPRRDIPWIIAITTVACDAGKTRADDPGNEPSGTAGSATGAAGGPPANSIVMKDPAAYPQNTPGARFPYPQGHALPHCGFPAYNTDTVAVAYQNWKTKFFQGGRVIRPENANDTVSEGVAYGMLIGVYMNDKSLFDALWGFAQGKFDSNGLMNWHIDANGAVVNQGGATDADEDMAFALLMAGVQWGGPYTAAATTMINAVWEREVEAGSNVLKPGDNFGGASMTNPSYFAPSYYRAFAKATPAHNWLAVVDSSYQILNAGSGASGLVPNWINAQGTPTNGPGNDANGVYFGYDACRTPWRIGLDYCENGEPRAKAYLDKIIGFYATTSQTGGVGVLRDGYTTTGTNPPGTLGDYSAGMAFYGPGGVGAMAGGHDALLANTYASLTTYTSPAFVNVAGTFTYFQASWGVLSLLAMSGNFWDMAVL